MALRKEAGFYPDLFWIHPSSMNFINNTQMHWPKHLVASVGEGVLLSPAIPGQTPPWGFRLNAYDSPVSEYTCNQVNLSKLHSRGCGDFPLRHRPAPSLVTGIPPFIAATHSACLIFLYFNKALSMLLVCYWINSPSAPPVTCTSSCEILTFPKKIHAT